jgi:hypothetical protein
VSFAAVTLCVDPQRMFIVVVNFVIDSVRKHLDTPSYFIAKDTPGWKHESEKAFKGRTETHAL